MIFKKIYGYGLWIKREKHHEVLGDEENETMTEFEAASLGAMYLQAGIAGLVGLVQCLLIAYGLKMMQQGNADRQRQTDLAEKRHEENILGLRTLIERTAPPSQV